MKKTKDIPRNIKQSISSSYVAYGKRYGFDSSAWQDYFAERSSGGKRRKVTRKWMLENQELATAYLEEITERHTHPQSWSNYQEYLDSEQWAKTRAKFLKGRVCLRCGKKNRLVLHHLRYKDDEGVSVLGKETEDDLAVLCWNCHSQLHEKYGRGASFGLEEIFEKEEDWVVIFRSGKKIKVNASTFSVCKEALKRGDEAIIFGDAVFIAREIEMMLKESTYFRNEEALK